MSVRPAKTQISLGIRPVWSESSLSAWRNRVSLTTHWAHNEDSDQTGRIPRLIWVFAGRTLILLVLSCRGSFMYYDHILSVIFLFIMIWFFPPYSRQLIVDVFIVTSRAYLASTVHNRHFWFISDSDSDSDTDFYLALLAMGNLSFIHYYHDYLQQVSLPIYRVWCFDIPTPDAKTI